jgi:ABC-type oligopeptide transport system ATPase subunit
VQGTEIAIDEPEMSMHISWQNKLINALLQISSKANPQYIFATHSPDIAATYSNSLKTVTYGKK